MGYFEEDFTYQDGDDRQTDKAIGGPILAVCIVATSVVAAVVAVAMITVF